MGPSRSVCVYAVTEPTEADDARSGAYRVKEITVPGSYIYNDEFDRAIELVATQQIAVADLTITISPLPDALTAFDALHADEIMKALIGPGA